MPASLPTAMLWLIAGLAVGTGGGYFWGADSQMASATKQEQAAPVANNIQQATGGTTSLAAAIQNPTGLRLVGTLVQPERSKSKAWLLQVSSDTTQSYAEGDLLPGGYQLTSIGAEDLQVSKDGYSFTIRRASTASAQNTNAPCEPIAQNSHSSEPKTLEHSNHPNRADGVMGRHRKPATDQSGQQRTQHRTAAEIWGAHTVVEGEETLDDSNSDADADSSSDEGKAPNATK